MVVPELELFGREFSSMTVSLFSINADPLDHFSQAHSITSSFLPSKVKTPDSPWPVFSCRAFVHQF
jgi:hypothetical protein